MLLMPNRKKVATIIVSGLRGGDKKPPFVQKMGEEGGGPEFKAPEAEEESASDDMGLESAMEEFIAAVEKKDAIAAASAFRSAMTLCEDTGDYTEGD